MLKQLYIKNYTLIDELNIGFKPNFSVITGETGAGKSIIIGAIGLLLGQRADIKQIKEGEKKCVVEAHFDISNYNVKSIFDNNDIEYDETDCIIRREVLSSGKSRAFINDTPTSLALLKEIGTSLVDIHSQHQNLLLSKEDFQLSVVDIIADNAEILEKYKKEYNEYTNKENELKQLKELIAREKENEDYLKYRFNEIDSAKLIIGEQEELEKENEILSHAEDIKKALYEADNIFFEEDNGVIAQLTAISNKIENIKDTYTQIQDLYDRLETCRIELTDISQEISSQQDSVDFDPQKFAQNNERLSSIFSLQNKFKVNSIKELLDIHKDLQEKLKHVENSEENIKEIQEEININKEKCINTAKKISEKRKKTACEIEKQMRDLLVPLGIPKVRFFVKQQEKELSKDGYDKISFLFSANTGTPIMPINEVASGGEIARVMLSVKAMISKKQFLSTIIFDEIDTGVSGRVAEKMANIMRLMGKDNRQVIAITHLPQIAAMGMEHYKVEKQETNNGTISSMVQLSKQQRIEEIAKMLSGDNVTEAARNNAKELLNI